MVVKNLLQVHPEIEIGSEALNLSDEAFNSEQCTICGVELSTVGDGMSFEIIVLGAFL